MSPLKVTVTPEQQAAMQERLTEAWAPFLASWRTAAPAMAGAARDAGESLSRAAAPVVSPAP